MPPDPRRWWTLGVLSTSGLIALVWAIIEAAGRGWTDPMIVGAFGLATALLAAFVAWERRTPHPMLDVTLFRNPRFSAASGAITLSFFAMFGAIYFLTQYLQLVLGFSALEAGVRILPVAGGLVLAGPLSARLSEKVGAKVVVAAGLTFVSSALFLMTQFEIGSGYEIVAASFVVLGFGIGMAMTPATDAVMGSLPLAKASVGSAVNDAARVTGGALGVAVLGSIMSSSYRGEMDGAHDSLAGALASAAQLGGPEGARLAGAAQEAFVNGMHTAVRVGAAIALVGALVALFLLPARERTAVRAIPVPA